MTTIKATCPNCGDISLVPTDLMIELRGDTPYYDFYCPHCEQLVCHEANPRIVRVLAAAGVREIEEVFALELDQCPYVPLSWSIP